MNKNFTTIVQGPLISSTIFSKRMSVDVANSASSVEVPLAESISDASHDASGISDAAPPRINVSESDIGAPRSSSVSYLAEKGSVLEKSR